MSAEETPFTMDSSQAGTEAELETFRRQWREEVSGRNKTKKQRTESDAIKKPSSIIPGPSRAHRKDEDDYSEELEPRTYQEEQLRHEHHHEHDGYVPKEPSNALEHYERAVERETQGNLSESMRHYRKAFKLDDGVHEAYKRKHFPPSSFVTPKSTHTDQSTQQSSSSNDNTFSSLISSFSTLRIEPALPATDASPPTKSPISDLPDELLIQILTTLAVIDIAAFAQVPQVCKRLAYLAHTEQSIWKRVALGSEWGFSGQHYSYACTIEGAPLDPFASDPHLLATSDHEAAQRGKTRVALETRTDQLLRTAYSNSYRQMFRSRPRLRFSGVYISTVNYTRAGGPATNTLTWGNPIHVVTYFRYLRFFRDGSLISLLTTSEPADVVHHLTKENLHAHHPSTSLLPSVVMKDALSGRWRLTGGAGKEGEEEEEEGEVCCETEGVVTKYLYVMRLVVSSAGKKTKGNKLAWKGFWSWNRVTEDWARFELRNDRAFYWSRVKSFE